MIEQPDIIQPILVVEDEPDTADLVKLILQEKGYQVVHAADGQDALNKIASMSPPSLVLLDIQIASCRRHHYSGNDPSDPRLATCPGGPPDGCRRSALYPSGGGYQGPGLHPQTIYARRSGEMC